MIAPEHWEKLAARDPEEAARASLARREGPLFRLTLAGEELLVDPAARRVVRAAAPGGKPASFLQELVAVCYLGQARNEPAAGEWLAPAQLPGGQFYFRGHHALPPAGLAAAFGGRPADLLAAGARLGAKPAAFGDAAAVVPALPRLPLLFIVWGGDEEFPPRAAVLFDRGAPRQLPLDALGALVEVAVKRLVEAALQREA